MQVARPREDQVAAIGPVLIQRAKELAPLLRARAERAERDRRLPDETIADFRRSRITRALQPERYGGYGADFGVAARIAEALARGCPSSSWVYCNFILLQWHVGLFPAEAQDEIWSDTDALVAAAYMPAGMATRTPDGYRLSGKWNYVSGIDNAEWCMLGGRVLAPDGRVVEQGFFLLPRGDYEVEDIWHVVGLAGTGSKDVIVTGAQVPARRMLSLELSNSGRAPGRQVNPHPIFRAPLYGIFSYFLSGVVLGAAQGAIDDFIAEMKGRSTVGGVTGKQVPLSQFPTVQIALAEAEAMVDAGRTIIQRDCDAVVATLMAGRELSTAQRIDNRRSVGFGVRLARQAVDTLFDVTGAGGLFLSSPIQRHWRDAHAVAHHFSLNWNQIGSLVGAYKLGLEPTGMY